YNTLRVALYVCYIYVLDQLDIVVILSWVSASCTILALYLHDALPICLDDQVVPLSNGVRLYQAAPPPRAFQPTRGGHVQTFAEPVWREVMLRFLDDPQGFVGLRRLAEIANPDSPQ